jgi:hypothetical protein
MKSSRLQATRTRFVSNHGGDLVSHNDVSGRRTSEDLQSAVPRSSSRWQEVGLPFLDFGMLHVARVHARGCFVKLPASLGRGLELLGVCVR